MSIKKVREKCGKKFCIIGNIDSSGVLIYGSDNEIILQTLEAIRDGALNGAMMLASDSDIRDEMPFDKVELMFKIGAEYGKYPIDIDAINERIERCKKEK